MKTINGSKYHRHDFESQKDSSRNIFSRLGHIVKRLENVSDRRAKFSTHDEPRIWKKKIAMAIPITEFTIPKAIAIVTSTLKTRLDGG